MPLPAVKPQFTPDLYLEWEAGQREKHEYVAGETFAMSGASDAHITVAGNVYMALRNHLRGGPCRVFMADMKVQVEQADAFVYLSLIHI